MEDAMLVVAPRGRRRPTRSTSPDPSRACREGGEVAGRAATNVAIMENTLHSVLFVFGDGRSCCCWRGERSSRSPIFWGTSIELGFLDPDIICEEVENEDAPLQIL